MPKILLQRVNHASVTVGRETIGEIEHGVLLLVGFGRDDGVPDLERVANKIVNLRIFANEDGRLDRSLLDVGGAILAVPQFTLYGETCKGRRPDFTRALEPVLAESRFESFVECLRRTPVARVETGRFAAHMKVSLENDGPFTLMLE